MSKKSIQTYETAVERVRGLLANWLDAGVELFVELNKVERSNVWKTPEHATFGDFLTTEFPNHALSLDRYRHVIQAIEVHGIARVRQLGVESCHAIIAPKVVNDPEVRQRVSRAIDRYLSDKGTAPPPPEVRRIVKGETEEVSPLATASRKVRRDDSLILENRELRQKLQAANKRIRELEAELERVKRAPLAKANGKRREQPRARA